MITTSKSALTLALASLSLGLAPFAAAHPHDDAASHQAEHGVMEPAGGLNEMGRPDYFSSPQSAAAAAAGAVEGGAGVPSADTQDFNIEDFLDANGQVNLEKLRAYEAGEPWRDIPAQNNGQNYNSAPPIAPDVLTFPQDQIIFVPEGQDYNSDMMMGGDTDIEVYDFSSGNSDKISPETGQNSSSIETIIRMTGEDDVVWNSQDIHSGSVHGSHGGSDSVRVLKYKNSQSSDAGDRSISLSGETTIKIGRDGGITIVNNGQSVIPLEMKSGQSGSASAMVQDEGKPAKVKINKTVETRNGKRMARVVIEMESEERHSGGH